MPKHRISRIMSISVIYLFEIIDISHDNGIRLLLPGKYPRMECLIQTTSVFQSGQLIKKGFIVQQIGFQCFGTENSNQ